MMSAILLMILTVNPSPMDSFQVNSLNTRIEMVYEVNLYDYHGRTGNLLSFLNKSNEEKPIEESNFIINGSWSTDGSSTAYLQRNVGGRLFDNSGKSGMAVDSALFITAKSQTLQYLGANRLQEPLIVGPRSEKYPVPCFGPWIFGSFQRFDADFALIKSAYSKDIIEVRYQNKPMIAEQYKAIRGEATFLKTIVYNPEEGYHPAFIRTVTAAGDSCSIQDIYITSTTKMTKDGYFATRWYKVNYSAANLANALEKGIQLGQIPYSGIPTLTRFEAKQWDELKKPLAFQRLTNSDLIFTPKDAVKIKTSANKEIPIRTLDPLSRRSPNAEDLQKRSSPHIDPKDTGMPKLNQGGQRKFALIVSIILISVVITAFYLRKHADL